MIIDVEAFIAQERPTWDELERALDHLERDAAARLSLSEVRRFHYLYQRTSGDLARLATFASERALHAYLEQLVARAYSEIHATQRHGVRLRPWEWLSRTFPQTVRRHAAALWLSIVITLVGSLFGAGVLLFAPQLKPVLMPFPHLLQRPSERVRKEESATRDRLAGQKESFSAMLMTHNTQVAITTFGLGLTCGVGTVAELFYNGVIIGAIAEDYIADGQTVFLVGWLLPHGSFEIPAILLAGQAGLILAGALIGWGSRQPLRRRLRAIAPDLLTMICGIALMLVWAGIVEAFFSQYHAPVLPYSIKIAFGSVELALLVAYLTLAGRERGERAPRYRTLAGEAAG